MSTFYYVDDKVFEYCEDATAHALRAEIPRKLVKFVKTDMEFNLFSAAYKIFRYGGCSIEDAIACAAAGPQ